MNLAAEKNDRNDAILTEDFVSIYRDSDTVKEIISLLNDKHDVHLKGLIGSQRACVAAGVVLQTACHHMFILSDKEEAAYFQNDLKNLLSGKEVLFYPDTYKRPLEFGTVQHHQVLMRTEVISRLQQTGSSGEVIVTYPEALTERVVKAEALRAQTLRLRVNEKADLDFMIDLLVEFSFERVDFVYEPGQFSIRGDIIDIYSYGHEYPYRIELFGKDVESIRTFDPLTQLSRQRLMEVSIVPNIQSHFGDDSKTVVTDILPPDTCVWIYDAEALASVFDKALQAAARIQPEIRRHAPEYPRHPLLEEDAEKVFADKETFFAGLSRFPVIGFGSKAAREPCRQVLYKASPQPSFNKNFDLLIRDLQERTETGYRNFIFSENENQIQRFRTIFHELKADVQFSPVYAGMHEGFIDHTLKLCCYTDHQIFNRYHRYQLRQGFNQDKALLIKTLRELRPGDYVTHIDHGVGVFSGLEKIEVGGQIQEAVRLVYAGNDILYVGIQSLHKISKYVGKEGETPRVHKLGSDTWSNLKRKTKKRIKELAFDLIQLYAKRKASRGYQFSADSYLQDELEASFMYEDTPDQAKATQEVKRDMEAPYPMDRLICGDVGFGKTEIAIRAAFKAACDGKQVAVLAPTTILVMQHARTFKERLAGFPVTVEHLNRFRTAKERKEILQKTEAGKVDILIGTHALLNKNVKFKDLGLLIIDEEQKFGVAAKETLKTLRANIDTLTLTATPIPRTLSFSLMGARDLSIIQTPPPNRRPITTEVHTPDPEIIKEAILYEVHRGGQVFFVHNRVRDISEVKEMLTKLLPNVSIAVAHGQMPGETLEDIITRFINREYDVLLCTNIIENGIDIPNANTIIVNQAHQFGLSDLHQLRGRVGRSDRNAFCYLLAPPLHQLSNEARQRLKTIEEFADLGSGFNIALRDLDIRGAGNLLGAEQSGFIAEIGYDTYQKILDEAIRELKESEFRDLYRDELEKTHDFVNDCAIETDLEMHIPSDYVSSTTERMLLYRELNDIRDEEGLRRFEEQLRDRFGDVPQPVYELFDAMRLKWKATRLGMEQIILKKNSMRCYFVSNKESAFYHSSVFDKILQYVQQHRTGVFLRETEKYLVLTWEHVTSMHEAGQKLNELASFVST
ncbi:MAG: transcription-repair coupling factor [Chitinophagales bacterium]|nr:transcription-repair coupling factor [Chitinophagales bacterium]MDW8418774.1 transcription-repair coupling factor [Chitinophagales bacterium]